MADDKRDKRDKGDDLDWADIRRAGEIGKSPGRNLIGFNHEPAAEKQDGDEKPRRRTIREWFRHAFKVEDYSESVLSEQDKAVLKGLARRVSDRRVAGAAILWIYSHRNLNFVGSQALIVLEPFFEATHPFLNAFLKYFGLNLKPEEYQHLALALEKRYSIEYLVEQLEEMADGDYNKRSVENSQE